jgi:2-polyprenyl-3-methyl-5-hydroxy-6-metoxy-1,4-benzoquinol methylase
MVENFFNPTVVYNNINSVILELYEKETNVLDIGCGTGILAQYIHKMNPDSYIVGLDQSCEVINETKKNLNEFYLIDLDTEQIPVFEKKFDLVILGDVLEHLKRPDLLLNELHNYLIDDGKVIISIPNIALATVRCQLLMGDFNYQSTGILDNSHLRFFTYHTIRKLIKSAGYKIIKCRCIIPKFSHKVVIFMQLCNLISYCFNKKPMKKFEWECSQYVFKLEQIKKQSEEI